MRDPAELLDSERPPELAHWPRSGFRRIRSHERATAVHPSFTDHAATMTTVSCSEYGCAPGTPHLHERFGRRW
jgi:hypothetical protein